VDSIRKRFTASSPRSHHAMRGLMPAAVPPSSRRRGRAPPLHSQEPSIGVEDPFGVLSALVPDPPCSLLTPLIFPPTRDSLQIISAGELSPKDPSVASEPPVVGSISTYRHWTITRPAAQRGKAKEAAEERPSALDSRKPRALHN